MPHKASVAPALIGSSLIFCIQSVGLGRFPWRSVRSVSLLRQQGMHLIELWPGVVRLAAKIVGPVLASGVVDSSPLRRFGVFCLRLRGCRHESDQRAAYGLLRAQHSITSRLWGDWCAPYCLDRFRYGIGVFTLACHGVIKRYVNRSCSIKFDECSQNRDRSNGQLFSPNAFSVFIAANPLGRHSPREGATFHHGKSNRADQSDFLATAHFRSLLMWRMSSFV